MPRVCKPPTAARTPFEAVRASPAGQAAGGVCVHAIGEGLECSYSTHRCWTLQQHYAGPWSHHAVAAPSKRTRNRKGAKIGGVSPSANFGVVLWEPWWLKRG
jgi:hypothetical protein